MTRSDLTSLNIEQLEDRLNSFDAGTRSEALQEIANRIKSGDISIPPVKDEVNLHYHTFFSYNGNGWSPSRISWETRKYGLMAAGIVDFDVLDGMEEFLAAGETMGIRSTAALETRVLISEYSEHVISSPNEPGIAYFMAGGCYKMPENGSNGARILQSMRDMARQRNLDVLEKVNNYLDKVKLDYDADVLPLTPSGNATERHMLAAYDVKARKVFGDETELAQFWSGALGISTDEANELLKDTPKLHEKMRAKLMKFGGVGYMAPTPETFPSIELVIEMTNDMGALPTATWLDGTSSGESNMPAMLGLLAKKGVVAMNIIPDRNWNIKNPDEKQVKVENLRKVIEAAREVDFPLCVGTEMNKAGLPFVDNFSAPELQPHVADFLEGAYFFWGHTFLAGCAGMGFLSDWANANFSSDRARKNEFYAKVGRLADPVKGPAKLAGKDLKSAAPDDVLKVLR